MWYPWSLCGRAGGADSSGRLFHPGAGPLARVTFGFSCPSPRVLVPGPTSVTLSNLARKYITVNFGANRNLGIMKPKVLPHSGLEDPLLPVKDTVVDIASELTVLQILVQRLPSSSPALQLHELVISVLIQPAALAWLPRPVPIFFSPVSACQVHRRFCSESPSPRSTPRSPFPRLSAISNCPPPV